MQAVSVLLPPSFLVPAFFNPRFVHRNTAHLQLVLGDAADLDLVGLAAARLDVGRFLQQIACRRRLQDEGEASVLGENVSGGVSKRCAQAS